ncbi:radial spoke head protein 3 homolog isoform X4 [Corvus kubaryi]|uniref:radial spoke head protein 3 homolog isoform X4 n=1 Tax=Corvus kubaryi TaxID=68294 RepID=UPI001C03AEC7|nr:radial spoke head protein 3 homolog isoform X4 [Corvus kubaryi]
MRRALPGRRTPLPLPQAAPAPPEAGVGAAARSPPWCPSERPSWTCPTASAASPAPCSPAPSTESSPTPPRRECWCPADRAALRGPLPRCPPRLSPQPSSLPALPGERSPRRPAFLVPGVRGPQPALSVLCRREKGPRRYGNIMIDPRVVRGNALSIRLLPELFDFDIEVKPILEVLVGKTVEQALLEVMEEEELAQLWSHQRAFAELRNAELAELQRLEEQDRRIREEKERRRLEHLEKLRKQKETAEKVAARAFAQRYLADLIPSVFNNLHASGFFYDPIERDIETDFLPWLMSEVEETLQSKVLGRMMLDSLIRVVVEKRLDEFSHPPPSDQTEAPAEEPRATDAAPQVSGEADAAEQPVAEKEEADQPVAEE